MHLSVFLALVALPLMEASVCMDYLNGGVRDCCNSTGICQDSSCVVFGFKSSAKTECEQQNGKDCPNAVCNWTLPNCPDINQDPVHQKCFGHVVCSGGACDGEGALCLQSGNSINFKICGDSPSAVVNPPPSNPCNPMPAFCSKCTPEKSAANRYVCECQDTYSFYDGRCVKDPCDQNPNHCVVGSCRYAADQPSNYTCECENGFAFSGGACGEGCAATEEKFKAQTWVSADKTSCPYSYVRNLFAEYDCRPVDGCSSKMRCKIPIPAEKVALAQNCAKP